MKLWDNIRYYFYNKNITARIGNLKTQRAILNLNDAKSIGVLYDSTNPDNDIIITKFAENLRKQGKTVEILAFINDNKTEHKADIVVFNTKGLSWALVPIDERANAFAANKFDLLFAAFTDGNLPLEYIARISAARWRVGCFSESKTDYYDLMINMSGKTDLPYFLEQATYFLNQIKYDTK